MATTLEKVSAKKHYEGTLTKFKFKVSQCRLAFHANASARFIANLDLDCICILHDASSFVLVYCPW
jgi:hypothetical protein